MTRVLAAVVVGLLACGCVDYSHVATTNAPGIVDISTPPPHENGSDELYIPPDEYKPGQQAFAVFLQPAFVGGLTRHGTGGEMSFDISVEHETTRGMDLVPMQSKAWGISAGAGLFQLRDKPGTNTTEAVVGNPLSVEGYYRWFLLSVGGGPVIYPDTRDLGAQITLRAPLMHLRFRYVQHSGFEALYGFDLNFPLLFGWSR